MNRSGNAGADVTRPAAFPKSIVPLISGSAAIFLAYVVGSAQFGLLGAIMVAAVAVLFGVVYFASERAAAKEPEQVAGSRVMPNKERRFDEVADRLIALDEANEAFGSSLNSADMFRLVSSRVCEIFPMAAAALLVPDPQRGTLTVVNFDGANSELFRGLEVANSDGLAGRALASLEIETDTEPEADANALGGGRLAGFDSAAAIPLVQNNEVFAIYQIFRNGQIDRDPATIDLLGSIRDHITPIFCKSLAFERSLSTALTDTLTGLPNERAFFMVLENQLAESHRHRDERPLTVLSIDIRDFGAVNSMLGHAVGDRMLEFVGQRIGEHLRKMDFLARMVNDEFSVILPTASEKVAFEIIDRIRSGFQREEFEIAAGEGVTIALNVGWATFWKDGETSDQLLRAAHQRIRLAKSEQPANVVWFRKEYVN